MLLVKRVGVWTDRMVRTATAREEDSHKRFVVSHCNFNQFEGEQING